MKERAHAGKDPASLRDREEHLFKIAEEMRVVLGKTAYSPILKSAGDFSCGVFDADGDMVAQGPDLPIHLGSMPDAVRAVVSVFGSDVHDGDVFIHNDPYFGGSHLPDVNVVRPAFHDGRLLGYTCLRAHWPDVGICDARQLWRGDRDLRGGLALAAAAPRHQGRPECRSREGHPGERPHARRAAGRSRRAVGRDPSGVQRLQELARRYGARDWSHTMADVMDYSERLMRGALVDLPDGEGTFEDFCDGDGIADNAGRQRRPVPRPHAYQEVGRPTAGRFRGQRPAGERPDERTAIGDRIGRLLRSENGGGSRQPDPAELRLLAPDFGRGTESLCGQRGVPRSRRLRQP